jgi:tetratricopeptide (TPR) repeat protein
MTRARVAIAVLLMTCAADVAAADPEMTRLLERSQFWSNRQRDDLAREELGKALRLTPDDPEALALLARLQVRANQDRDAAATLERLRAAHPGHPAAAQIATLLRIRGADREKLRQARQLARAGRDDEALKAYDEIFSSGFPDDEHALEYAQVLAGTRNGREAGASSIAQLARKHPDDPRFQVAWATDLSTRRPVARSTLRMLKELSSVASVSRQARSAWRGAVMNMDAGDDAVAALREYIAANPGDTAVEEKVGEAIKAAAAARHATVAASKSHDGEAVGALGLERMREGRHAEAVELFQQAAAADPAGKSRWTSLERTARYWGLMQQARTARIAGDFDTARARANEAAAQDPNDPAAKEELAAIQAAANEARASMLRDSARPLREKNEHAQALVLLEEGATLQPDDPWLAHDLARTYAALGQPSRGEDLFRKLLDRRPTEPDVRYAFALFLSGVERDADALAMLETIPEAKRSDGVKSMQQRITASMKERATTKAAGDLAQASRTAEREGDLAGAVAFEERSIGMVSGDEPWRLRRLADLRERQLGWMGSALDALQRSGTPGKSRVNAEELSGAWLAPWARQGSVFARVAIAHVGSGALDLADSFEASTFGSLLLCQPACAGPAPAARHDGVALATGLLRDNFRFDIGVSPIGFPVVNLVGGALYRGDAGLFSYSIDVSRRPLASSLLSYAGTRDPNTGRVWGGVLQNGVRVNISRDSGGEYGAWSLAGLYRLTGRGVQDNDKAELMGGVYKRIVNEDNRVFSAGATAMMWRFSENAGEYTLGHGGYYSPRSYASLGFPVSFAMRTANTSLYARASVSVSWSESRAAPYFPVDPALQSQAEALAAAGGRAPFYAGGSNGRSYGRSFALAGEHRMVPTLYVGARLEIERSTNYTPNRFVIYMRMALGGVSTAAMAMPPEAVILPGFRY